MKKIISTLLTIIMLITIVNVPVVKAEASSAVNVFYRTHVQTYGWEGEANNTSTWKSNGTMSGTSGQSKRLEGIEIVVEGKDLGIQYTTHCQTYGWLPWSSNGEMNGTEGEAKRLEAIKIQLTGKDAKNYDVYYRVHAQSYGWLNWAKNGQAAGTAGEAKRLEGIQIVIVNKGETLPNEYKGVASRDRRAYVSSTGASDDTVPGADSASIVYRTHVQTYGWQNWVSNGVMAGTSGEAKRLESIQIKLSNQQFSGGIEYKTHVQSYGWQNWVSNGAYAGTSGESKRLEAICIRLTGKMAEEYDVYYRVHAQTFGWLGWAKNGACAGTSGLGKRLEGIEIIIAKKNNTPAGVTPEGNAYVEPATAPAPSHTHSWAWVKTKDAWKEWIVDKAAWTETINHPEQGYWYVYPYCHYCGADLTGIGDAHHDQYCETDPAHAVAGWGQKQKWIVTKEAYTEVINHPEEGHWVDHPEEGYYKCECGATK